MPLKRKQGGAGMKKRKKKVGPDFRQKCLFRTFADINYSFADWYQATQLEIEYMERELSARLLPNHL